MDGTVVALLSPSGWGHFQDEMAGRKIYLSSSATRWLFHPNDLGSSTMVTDQTGTVVQDATYYPWGQVWQNVDNIGLGNWNFAAFGVLEPTTNLYPTPNRRYDLTYSRWLSPDPAGEKAVSLADPQTWNMYSYVRDTPLTRTDPTGLQSGTLSSSGRQNTPYCAPENTAECAASPKGEKGDTDSNQDSGLSQEEFNRAVMNGVLTFMMVIDPFINPASVGLEGEEGTEEATATEAAGASAVESTAATAKESEAAAQESVSVYMKTDESYVGISNNVGRREVEHGVELKRVAGGLDRTQARGVEQAIIEQRGLAKNGGTLTNKINSIAPTNPIYQQVVQFGRQLLQMIHFD